MDAGGKDYERCFHLDYRTDSCGLGGWKGLGQALWDEANFIFLFDWVCFSDYMFWDVSYGEGLYVPTLGGFGIPT